MGAFDRMFAAMQGLLRLVLLAAPTTFGRPSTTFGKPSTAQLFEIGDMLLNAEQVPVMLRHKFGLEELPPLTESSPGVRDEKLRWPQGILNYDLSNVTSSEHKDLIKRALSKLETKLDSCIRFREVNTGFRVVVYEGSSCSSAVGYRGLWYSQQDLSLGRGCLGAGTIEHEFYHAIGVHHTQCRTDRDKYVKIIEENIKEGMEGQFAKFDKSEVSEFGLPYDFESVMHYGANDYGKDGKRTIETYDPSKQDIIGKAQGVSDGDIMLLHHQDHQHQHHQQGFQTWLRENMINPHPWPP